MEQLDGRELGEELILPPSCLRAEGDVLLDDVSPEDIGVKLGVKVSPAGDGAEGFIRSVLGI